MKAIINLQKTILDCSEGIYNKDDFVDNTQSSFTSMNKEERDLTLMMELQRILWEVNIPSELIKSLLQEKLNSESFIVENLKQLHGVCNIRLPIFHLNFNWREDNFHKGYSLVDLRLSDATILA